MDQITDHNKRLKLCIKWFQQIEESHLLEEERLRTALESAEKKCSAIGSVDFHGLLLLPVI